jgi:hypothetical protein
MELANSEIQERIDFKIKDCEKRFGKECKYLVLEIIGLEKMIKPNVQDIEKPRRSRKIPLVDWNKYHDYPTVSALRQYRFHSKNGFEDVIEYGGENGNRILINEDKFFIWYDNISNSKKTKQA